MKYVDGFRNGQAASALCDRIQRFGSHLEQQGRRIRIMEVCGTHTMAIARCGIRQLLGNAVDLISGPGCPVCVTDPGYIDAAVDLARKGCIVASFGDLLRVPGSSETLAEARAHGADIQVCYSPSEALAIARCQPEREVVFLGIGFETTAAPICAMLDRAIRHEVKNLGVLTAFKRIPPILDALMRVEGIAIDGFLLPAHVSAIIGAAPYRPLINAYSVSAVVAGFELLDILYGIAEILSQLDKCAPGLVNQYGRVVKENGNEKALRLMDTYLAITDGSWRGMGCVAQSALSLRPEYERFDAEKRHCVPVSPGRSYPRCRCGDVLIGNIHPWECALFGETCTPDSPAGPCMVSSEGSCAASFRYEESVR